MIFFTKCFMFCLQSQFFLFSHHGLWLNGGRAEGGPRAGVGGGRGGITTLASQTTATYPGHFDTVQQN